MDAVELSVSHPPPRLCAINKLRVWMYWFECLQRFWFRQWIVYFARIFVRFKIVLFSYYDIKTWDLQESEIPKMVVLMWSWRQGRWPYGAVMQIWLPTSLTGLYCSSCTYFENTTSLPVVNVGLSNVSFSFLENITFIGSKVPRMIDLIWFWRHCRWLCSLLMQNRPPMSVMGSQCSSQPSGTPTRRGHSQGPFCGTLTFTLLTPSRWSRFLPPSPAWKAMVHPTSSSRRSRTWDFSASKHTQVRAKYSWPSL